MKDHRYIYLGVFIAAFVLVIVGWRINGTRTNLIQSAANNVAEPLIEVEYSGGMIMEPSEARGRAVVTHAGELVIYLRSGEVDAVKRIDRKEFSELQGYVAELNALTLIAERKEEAFCTSWVDGVDLIYTFYVDGEPLVLSSCVWTPDASHPLMSTLSRLLR